MSPYCKGEALEARSIQGSIREFAHLFAGIEEELVRVNTITDGAANEGEPVENDGGLVGVLEQELAQDIDHDGQGNERQCADRDEGVDGLRRAVLAELVEETVEETHGGRGRLGGLKIREAKGEGNSQSLQGRGKGDEDKIEPRERQQLVPPRFKREIGVVEELADVPGGRGRKIIISALIR